MNILQSQYKKW